MSGNRNNIAALVLAAFLALPAASTRAEDAAAPPASPAAPVAAPVAPQQPTEPVAIPKPAIRFDSEKADMGIVKVGATPEHTFTFFNDGNELLRIISVSPS